MQPNKFVFDNNTDEFCFYPVSSYEIRKIVKSFPSNKAPGMDKVSVAVIKDALPIILPTLTEIVNPFLTNCGVSTSLEEIGSYSNFKGGGL